jgi:membrane-associated HD superfamily phosphohydrolase
LIASSVRHFLVKNKVKIIIGTPCFGGLLHNGFFQSMLELSVNFTKLNIPFEIMTIGNESLIQRARNGIVAKFMGDKESTHLMFIDADITFSWVSIVKLLLSGKELCGGCYPKKCFNWDKIKHHIKKNPDLKDDELMAKSLDYVFNPIYHKEGDNVVIKLDNGMAQVKDIGTGFMMIRKSVINKMIIKFPETKYRNNVAGYSQGENAADEYFYSLFDCCIDPVSRVYLSEDYLFCKRWIDSGGELWLDLNTNLNHTGIIDYKGCLSITIGEVDTLNKDAQILKQQQDNKDKENKDKENKEKKNISEKDKEIMRKKIEAQVMEAKIKQKEQTELEEKEKEKAKNKDKNLLEKTNEVVNEVVNEAVKEVVKDETNTETKKETNTENTEYPYNNHHC